MASQQAQQAQQAEEEQRARQQRRGGGTKQKQKAGKRRRAGQQAQREAAAVLPAPATGTAAQGQDASAGGSTSSRVGTFFASVLPGRARQAWRATVPAPPNEASSGTARPDVAPAASSTVAAHNTRGSLQLRQRQRQPAEAPRTGRDAQAQRQQQQPAAPRVQPRPEGGPQPPASPAQPQSPEPAMHLQLAPSLCESDQAPCAHLPGPAAEGSYPSGSSSGFPASPAVGSSAGGGSLKGSSSFPGSVSSAASSNAGTNSAQSLSVAAAEALGAAPVAVPAPAAAASVSAVPLPAPSAAAAPDEEEDEAALCVVCWEEKRTTVNVPCGHMTACRCVELLQFGTAGRPALKHEALGQLSPSILRLFPLHSPAGAAPTACWQLPSRCARCAGTAFFSARTCSCPDSCLLFELPAQQLGQVWRAFQAAVPVGTSSPFASLHDLMCSVYCVLRCKLSM